MDGSRLTSDISMMSSTLFDIVKGFTGKTSFVEIEAGDIDTGMRLTDLKIKQEELKGYEQDREQRKNFADKIFILLISFLGATLIITSLSAVSALGFKLSDAVLITLLATTTANIIAIFILVVRYLFKANMCPKCGVKVTSKSELIASI